MLSGPALDPYAGGAPTALLCLLHGLGASGNDLLPLGAALQLRLPHLAVVAPDGPFPCDVAPQGRMWFSIHEPNSEARRRGVREAAPIVADFVDAELAARRLPTTALILAGFSQGAMVALHVGLSRRPPPLAIISHSGLLADVAVPLAEDTDWRAPPVLLTHGDCDDRLSPACLEMAADALCRKGMRPDVHLMPGLGHGIDEATLALDIAFLRRVTVA